MLRIGIFIFLVLNLSSCSFKSAEIVSLGSLTLEQTELAKRGLAAKQGQLTSARVLFNAELKSGLVSKKFRYALIFRNDGFLKLEILPTQAAYSLGLLYLSARESVFLDMSQKQIYLFRDSRQALAEIVKLELEAKQLVPLLLARVPFALEQASFYQSSQASLLIRDRERKFALQAKENLVSYALLYAKDSPKPQAILNYENPKCLADFCYYENIKIQLEELDLTIELELVKLILNPEIPDSVFEASMPRGFEVIEF